MLLDLGSAAVEQQELIFSEPSQQRDQRPLMEVMDRINNRWGKAALHVASTAHTVISTPAWKMKQESRTPRYTTVLGEVPIARA